MSEKITVGCDPEFFIQPYNEQELMSRKLTEDTAGEVVPICGLIGGTKEAPLPLKELGAGFAVQEDGIACEFNIPPVETALEFSANVQSAVKAIYGRLKPHGVFQSYVKTVALKPEWTNKWPNLLQIGCDPDYCAYDTTEGPRELNHSKIKDFRGAGGHIHIGYNTKVCPPKIVAQLLDTVLAIPTLEEDAQGGRRAWWGDAGVYRPKEYGIEYRTLSNFWIWSGGTATLVAAHSIALVEGLIKNMVQWQAFWMGTNWSKVRNTILMEDKKAARDLFEQFRQHKCYADMLAVAQRKMFKLEKNPTANHLHQDFVAVGGANG